jgi:dTDP-glucose 4,6-dehydratase
MTTHSPPPTSSPTPTPRHFPCVIVTGGCGFIGANFIRWLLQHAPDTHIINVDALTYAGNLANLTDIQHHSRYHFLHLDVRDTDAMRAVCLGLALPHAPKPTALIHFAAESHVDRSISSPRPFVDTNVLGTLTLLEQLQAGHLQRLVHVSTDEVYGDLQPNDPPFTEAHPLKPSSPYAASKAAADLLVLSCVRTFGVDALITRCSNNYGPYQFPEKLIPLMTLWAMEGRKLPIYGNGLNVRDWIHVEDHCRGIYAALSHGVSGGIYHFGGASERTNLDVVHHIIRIVGADERLISFVHDRPGHDLRYAIDFRNTTASLGWTPQHTFSEGLAQTVQWYMHHATWWRPILSGQHRSWTQAQHSSTS